VRSSRLSSTLLASAFLFLALGAGCARPKSYVVLKLESGTPIADIRTVVVGVKQGDTLSASLSYDADPAIAIDDTHPSDLSVSFSGGQSGAVTFHVTVFDRFNCKVGETVTDTTGVIKGGNVGEVIVALSAFGGCSTRDGGADASPGDAFPGCDPVTPGCGAGKTCQVNCTKGVAECTAGGKGAPGASCATNADCAAGSQCFDYSGTGCGVKLCLRFCNNDNGCGMGSASDGGATDAGGGAAVGTRSLCAGPVQCSGTNTAYHTCTFGCDPREPAATAGSAGCPQGLSCLIVADMDQVDCACAEKTRVGKDNAPCTSSGQCAPGYICNQMSNAKVCRALCRCDASGMTCTAPNDCAGTGKTCAALTNDTVFGVCL
jgi:hypothetical protein